LEREAERAAGVHPEMISGSCAVSAHHRAMGMIGFDEIDARAKPAPDLEPVRDSVDPDLEIVALDGHFDLPSPRTERDLPLHQTHDALLLRGIAPLMTRSGSADRRRIMSDSRRRGGSAGNDSRERMD